MFEDILKQRYGGEIPSYVDVVRIIIRGQEFNKERLFTLSGNDTPSQLDTILDIFYSYFGDVITDTKVKPEDQTVSLLILTERDKDAVAMHDAMKMIDSALTTYKEKIHKIIDEC